MLSTWHRKQCFSLSNLLICIIDHLTVALSVGDFARIIDLMCLKKAFYSHRNDLEISNNRTSFGEAECKRILL